MRAAFKNKLSYTSGGSTPWQSRVKNATETRGLVWVDIVVYILYQCSSAHPLRLSELGLPSMFPTNKMYLSATLIIVALSAFVEVTSALSSGISIPIRKGAHSRDANGVVNLQMLKRSVHHTVRFAYPLSFPLNGL